MSSPIPCSQCGNLFMRKDLTLDAPRLCNNCEYAQLKKMSTKLEKVEYPKEAIVAIEIECSHLMASEIEEICMNFGISFSEYFIKTHRFFMLFNRGSPEGLKGGDSQFSENQGNIDSTVKHAIKMVDLDNSLDEFEKYDKEILKKLVTEKDEIINPHPKIEEKSEKTHKKKVKK